MQTFHTTKLKWKLTEEEKNQLVIDYCNGVKISILCKSFHGIDHSTVYYHVKKAGVLTKNGKVEYRTIRQIIQKEKHSIKKEKELLPVTDFDGEAINQGHDYAEYLRIEKERKYSRFGLINNK